MNYYICHRYWCEEKNISIKESDVKKENNKLISEKCKDNNNNYLTETIVTHKNLNRKSIIKKKVIFDNA